MNSIFQALNSGYPADKVLEYISKALPHLGGSIYKAKSAGYTVKQILGFLAKTNSERDTKGMSDPEIRAMNSRTEGEMVKNGLTMTAGALGTSVLGRAAAGAIAPHLPALSNRGTPNAPGTSHVPLTPSPSTAQVPQQITPQQPSPNMQNAPTSGANPVSSSPQQPPISNANISTQPVKTINAKEILDKYNATNNVNNLLNSNQNDTGKVAAWLKKFNGGSVSKIEKETGKSIEDFLQEYLDQNQQNTPNPEPQPNNPSSPPPAPISPGSIQQPIGQEPLLPNHNPLQKRINEGREERLKSQQEFIKKHKEEQASEIPEEEIEETVITPSGKGIIKEISGDNALIEEDGKLKQHKLDKVMESPLPEKDLAELYEDLIKGIEKHSGKPVSRNVESAGYDPKNNELVYKPHGSDKFYVYDDISPEDVDTLTNLLTQRKSTGSNFIGAWESGTESPIGAAMYQLIKKLQAERGGKGNEYKNKFETIYDALEPAKEALKKKYAEAKKKAKKPRAS